MQDTCASLFTSRIQYWEIHSSENIYSISNKDDMFGIFVFFFNSFRTQRARIFLIGLNSTYVF